VTTKEPYEQGIEEERCICGHRKSDHHFQLGACTYPPFGQCDCWQFRKATWWRRLGRKLGIA